MEPFARLGKRPRLAYKFKGMECKICGGRLLLVCICGHTGDDEGSQHTDTSFLFPGLGKCLVKGCGCSRFIPKQSI